MYVHLQYVVNSLILSLKVELLSINLSRVDTITTMSLSTAGKLIVALITLVVKCLTLLRSMFSPVMLTIYVTGTADI